NAVNVEFKKVRLNGSIPVIHRHGVGQCEGTLEATVNGLAYRTSNKGDAFTLRFDDLDQFEVDYLKKNLRVKQRGGKTWNFTDRRETADGLFVFHRHVQKAPERLAAARGRTEATKNAKDSATKDTKSTKVFWVLLFAIFVTRT